MTADSRSLADLHPIVRAKCEAHMKACADAGMPIRITFTYRSNETQDILYSLGRSLFVNPFDGMKFKKGQHITNAKAGQSFHNFGLAYDGIPEKLLVLPKWGDNPRDQHVADAAWALYGQLGKAQSLIWGAEFHSIPDRPHMQWSAGLTLAQLRAGRRPPNKL
jgi:peptidoglycan L-alanyl-D-glutamate endopeptidase CwlK